MDIFDHQSGEYLQIEDANIYYEVKGDASCETLLMLHGGLGNIEIFNHALRLMPNNYRIIGIDSRGHGRSTLGSQDLSYALLQNEVEAVLQHLGIRKVSIIGFSNGGTVAYRLAAKSDLEVNKIITLGSPWNRKHVKAMRDLFSNLAVDDWIQHCSSDYEQYQYLNPEPDIHLLFQKAVRMTFDDTDAGFPNENIQKISCKLLIARGEHDPVVSFEDLKEFSGLVKDVQMLNIKAAGHSVLVEQPQIFSNQVIAFFEK